MKFNKWTVALASIGVVSLASAAHADEQPMKMNAVQTALSNTTISGYVDTSAIWRPGTDKRNGIGPNIPPYSFDKNDGFYLDSVDIALDKPEDESPWAAGYHVEMMYGPDAVGLALNGSGAATPTPVQVPGVEGPVTVTVPGQTVPVGVNGLALRQAYVTLRMPVGNGIDWKVGLWDTIVGYESNSDPLNPNFSRSYGYTIEPTTHTGILATYKFNDMVTVQAGIADDSNTTGTIGVNPALVESQKAYMGDIAFTAPDSAGFMKGATLYFGAIDAAGNGTTSPGSTSWYAGMTLPTPISALTLGSCFDYLDIHNGGVPGNSSNDSLWNIAFYSSIQATDKLSFHTRFEYLDGSAAPGFFGPGTPAYSAFELTGTVQYNLWENVISRAEIRWDHATSGNSFGVGQGSGAPNRRNDVMLALNLIYQF